MQPLVSREYNYWESSNFFFSLFYFYLFLNKGMSIEILANSSSAVCTTPECNATAESILEFIDFNVDPCSDFYQYTCNNKTLCKHFMANM